MNQTKTAMLAIYRQLKAVYDPPAGQVVEPVVASVGEPPAEKASLDEASSGEVPWDWNHDFLTWTDEELAELEVFTI